MAKMTTGAKQKRVVAAKVARTHRTPAVIKATSRVATITSLDRPSKLGATRAEADPTSGTK